jgi:hypothetical protein
VNSALVEPFIKEVLCARSVLVGMSFVFSVRMLQDAIAFVNTYNLSPGKVQRFEDYPGTGEPGEAHMDEQDSPFELPEPRNKKVRWYTPNNGTHISSLELSTAEPEVQSLAMRGGGGSTRITKIQPTIAHTFRVRAVICTSTAGLTTPVKNWSKSSAGSWMRMSLRMRELRTQGMNVAKSQS